MCVLCEIFKGIYKIENKIKGNEILKFFNLKNWEQFETKKFILIFFRNGFLKFFSFSVRV